MFRYWLFLLFYGLALESVGAFEPVFSGQADAFNQELTENYQGFQKNLSSSVVYQESQAATHRLLDYTLCLANFVKEENVAKALDYLLKTGGPFGISKRQATSQEQVLLAAVAQIIAIKQPSLVHNLYGGHTTHQQAIQRLQQQVTSSGDFPHPYHPRIDLPSSADFVDQNLKPNADQTHRWRLFLDLLSDYPWVKGQFTLTKDLQNKLDWLNTPLLCGYLMGVIPDVEKGKTGKLQDRDYLDNLWKQDNLWMESNHKYVQWFFPTPNVGQGDRIAPRYSGAMPYLFQGRPEILTEIQAMMRMSLARKANFWGQRLVYTKWDSGGNRVDLIPLKTQDGDKWEQNWIHKTHNYQRMSRFLESLGLFGLLPEQQALWAYLTEIKTKYPQTNNSYENFWKPAVGQK